MTPDQQRYIEEEQAWLLEYGDIYREGIKNLESQTYVRGLLRGIEKRMMNALSYNPREDGPHVAVFIIGEMQAKMEKVLTDLDFIDEYEQRREDFNATIANVQPDDDGSQSGQPEVMDEL